MADKAKEVANDSYWVGKTQGFYSDYYLENAEPDEIEAIVAHGWTLKQTYPQTLVVYCCGYVRVLIMEICWIGIKIIPNEINPYLGWPSSWCRLFYISPLVLAVLQKPEKKTDNLP